MKNLHPILVSVLLAPISLLLPGSEARGQTMQLEPLIRTIYIGPELVDCAGVGSGRAINKCYQFKEYWDDAWQTLDGPIRGFAEYEEDYIYQLQVRATSIPDAPAGTSSTKYELVRILSKLPASPLTIEHNLLPASIIGKNWQLVSLQSADEDVTQTAGAGIAIMFDAYGKVSGSGGCNSYSGIYEVGLNNDLEVEGIVSTKVACSNSKMKLEEEYFEALEKVGSWAQDDSDRLQLRMSNGNILKFAVGPVVGMPRSGSPLNIVAATLLAVLCVALGLHLSWRFSNGVGRRSIG